MPHDLKVAILLWKRGSPVPTDLAMRLAAQGYDIDTLQSRYER